MNEKSSQSFGAWLRETRRSRGLTLEQVSEVIRIDVPYLRALESGNIAVLPEPYIRAFLMTYAGHLKLDEEEAVHRLEAFLLEQSECLENVRAAVREKEGRWYPDGTRASPAAEGEGGTLPSETGTTFSRRNQLLAAGVVIAVIALATFLAVRFTGGVGRPVQPPAARQGEPAERGEESPPPEPGTTAGADTSRVEVGEPPAAPERQQETTQPQPAALHLLVAEAMERTWVQAVVDGDTVVSRIILAGNSVRIPFVDTLIIKAGKNHGLRMMLDGRQIGDLGPPGYVLSRLVITGSGVVQRRLSLPPDRPPSAAWPAGLLRGK